MRPFPPPGHAQRSPVPQRLLPWLNRRLRQPSAGYGAPTLLCAEPVTSQTYGSALIVEFVPVADQLAADEFYEFVLVTSNRLAKSTTPAACTAKASI